MARPGYTNTVQGSVDASQVATNMAINGEGFFMVSQRVATVDSNPVFQNVNYYTRRGDFSMDKNGYLVNGGGYYLQGVAIDPATNNPVGDTPSPIKVNNSSSRRTRRPTSVTQQICRTCRRQPMRRRFLIRRAVNC